MSRIDKILLDLNEAPASAAAKTASANESALDAAINNALASVTGQPKTASAQPGTSPVSDLMKLAHEVREADSEAEVKLAHRMGAAWADGMMERLELYRQSADELDKTAGMRDLDPAAFDGGFVEKAAEIHAVTAAHFIEGYRALERALA